MAKKAAERRQHKRLAISCPITLLREEGQGPLKGKTLNVSDGGVFLAVPAQSVPQRGWKVGVKLLVPRSTPNTYMLEEFSGQANVLRHDILKDNSLVGVALQFPRPLKLELEV